MMAVQLTSGSHHDTILSSMQQLRLQGHFTDVTVQVDYQGELQEFHAHQVMLAAASGYFRSILLSQDAGLDKLLVPNMHSGHFSKFLEFVYTGKVEVALDKIGEVQAVAQLLDCKDLSEVCGEVMRATEKAAASNVEDPHEAQGGKREKRARRIKQPESLIGEPRSSETEVASKRLKAKHTGKTERRKGRPVKPKTDSPKFLQRSVKTKSEALGSENQVANEVTIECEAQPENQAEEDGESSLEMKVPDVDKWEHEGEVVEEEEEAEEGESPETSKRTSKAQFQCNKCQRTFHYERSYLKHISTYHGVKADVEYRCETCLQTFANRSNLNIHEKHVHSNVRLFPCSSCAKTFKRKKDVVRHQNQVHERSNLRHVCTDCGKSLSSKTALLLHERIHTGTKPFECADCGTKFTQNAALKMHRRTHTGEKPFACDECDSRFSQKHMLAYHKRSHTGEKPFMCEACGKSFASKEYLRHHSNIHTGSKPYKCEHCGRGFAQRNSLHQHLKIHTGERPYSCKVCSKQFTQINALQRHQRIHTGEKPYMCGLCNRTFTDMSTLRRHTMTHDADAPWKTYLVVLKGNVEEKKPKYPTMEKAERAAGKKMPARKGGGAAAGDAGADGDTGSAPDAASAAADGVVATCGANTADTDAVAVQQVTLSSNWTRHGTIALVSQDTLGSITVIHTEMPPGTHIQPIMTTDGTGANVISLDASAIPFSIPVSMAHPVPLSSCASSSASLSVPSVLSVPVSNGALAPVAGIPAVSASSVLEAAASQTILAPALQTKMASEMDIFQPNIIQTVIVGEEACGEEPTAAERGHERPRVADDSLDELEMAPGQEAV